MIWHRSLLILMTPFILLLLVRIQTIPMTTQDERLLVEPLPFTLPSQQQQHQQLLPRKPISAPIPAPIPVPIPAPIPAPIPVPIPAPIPVGPIPHILWFTYSHNLLETKNPSHFYNNVRNTIDTYVSFWNTTNNNNNTTNKVTTTPTTTTQQTQINFLNDAQCLEYIHQVEPLLTKPFQTLMRGDLKGDLCRTAALYLFGGYYFDIDIQVLQPVVLADHVSFATVMTDSRIFFNAFIASTPKHDILQATLQSFVQYYINHTGYCRNGNYQDVVGCCTLWDGYHNTPISHRGETFLLEEEHLKNGLYPNQPSRGTVGPYCDFVVHHNKTRQIYFYSRIVGSRHCQE